MKNIKTGKEIDVMMDEDANFCVIAGTNDRSEAEKALREAEDDWYGKDHVEEPMSMDSFSAADIFYGEKGGEYNHYWGNNPKEWFSNGEFETMDGFICNL